MKNKIKLIGILLLIFLVSLSIASAANDTQTNTTSTITQDTQINTEPTQTINKTQKTLNTKQENTTQKPTVTNKKETNNTVPEKSAAANYKELKSQIYNIAYNGSADVNYTIKLTGTNYRFGTKIFIDRATANLTIIGDSTSKTTITLNGLQSCSLF
ncbi:MAG: hypothetical protein Q4Q23_07785 [Methanobacteriaceae archaeon]|nr:hypothetical protein [Methanobacteriaceae archaeon]